MFGRGFWGLSRQIDASCTYGLKAVRVHTLHPRGFERTVGSTETDTWKGLLIIRGAPKYLASHVQPPLRGLATGSMPKSLSSHPWIPMHMPSPSERSSAYCCCISPDGSRLE